MPGDPATRLLFIGDLHLGRRPGGVPEHLADTWGVSAADLSPGAAWLRAVRTAIARGVDAVALAGDLVDRDDDVFEAKAILDKGIKRLAAAGIAVYAVAGNHDTRVLPELADLIDDLHLLGRGGTWSSAIVTGAGAPVRLVGWSFPAKYHDTSPLAEAPPSATPGQITFGLLHGDLDAPRSRYAPVASAALKATGYARWFLGHVHKPDPLPGDDQPAYLGSLVGLDVGETGAHGPVLVTANREGQIAAERLLLAPLRWERHDVPADNLDTSQSRADLESALRLHLLHTLQDLADGLATELTETTAVGLRLRLTGSVANPALLAEAARALDPTELVTHHHDTLFFVEQLTAQAQVAVDLQRLSGRDDPAGLLAHQLRLLDQLQADPTSPSNREGRQLLDQARRRLAEVAGVALLRDFAAGDRDRDAVTDLDDDALLDLLRRTGQRCLGALLAQSGGDDAAG